jgi:hypothetical protein
MTTLVKIVLSIATLGLIAGGAYVIHHEMVVKVEAPPTSPTPPARAMTREENATEWRRIHGSQQDLPPGTLPGAEREGAKQGQ